MILTIILNWNGKEDTLDCLQSLYDANANASVLVVDNGSQNDSLQAIQERFPTANFIPLQENLGYAGGNNEGIAWGLERGFEYFFLLNNDTLVASDLFEKFEESLEKYPTVGIFGTKVYLQHDPMRLDHLGGNWNAQKAKIDFIGMRVLDTGNDFAMPISLDYVCGAGFLVRRAVFKEIGLLDPRYFLYWEDTDFCFRARRAGFGVQVCPNAKIWHKVSSSTSKEGKLFTSYFFWRNYLLWLENNIPWKKKYRAYWKIALEVWKSCLKFPIKIFLLYLLQKIQTEEVNRERKKYLRQNRAFLYGVRDYFLRRFGKGSSRYFSSKP